MFFSKKFIIGAASLLTFLPGCSVFGVRDTPEPGYSTIKQVKGVEIEIRQYEEMIVAKTTVSDDYKKSSREGFRRLADYIFGKNTTKTEIGMTAPVVQKRNKSESEEIGMTAPVFQEKSEEGKWEMSFVMPKRYTMETIPKPVDPKIKLAVVPVRKVAVLRYSGTMNAKKIEAQTKVLKGWVANSQYEAVSEYKNAGYDPPFTLPFLRRNEILVDVKLKEK